MSSALEVPWYAIGNTSLAHRLTSSITGCLEPGIYFMIYEEMKKHNSVGNMFSLHMQQTSIIPGTTDKAFKFLI